VRRKGESDQCGGNQIAPGGSISNGFIDTAALSFAVDRVRCPLVEVGSGEKLMQ
jgi:hypothetical protein